MTGRQKIPLLLKLKRFKNSSFVNFFNDLPGKLKPPKKFKGVPDSILFIRNDRIGDAVVTLPVMRDLKLYYPGIRITVLTSSRNKFVFEAKDYIDNLMILDWTPDSLPAIYRLPVLGGILTFIRYAVIRYFTSAEFRNVISLLRKQKFDIAVDLVGLKRNLLLSNIVSRFSVGPRKFGVYIFYSHYTGSNWVSLEDDDFMTRKIEKELLDALDLMFSTKDNTAFLYTSAEDPESYDIIIHLGSTPLRKLSFSKEEQLIHLLCNRKVLVTDSGTTPGFQKLQETFESQGNVHFRLFTGLDELAAVCRNSKILICYDGGQAHYLSQFIRTVAIFGPGSVALWRPYEFSGYELLETAANGVKAVISNGNKKHIAVYYPIWCRPCFDVGCSEVVCLREIQPDFINYIVNKYCFAQ